MFIMFLILLSCIFEPNSYRISSIEILANDRKENYEIIIRWVAYPLSSPNMSTN